MKWESNVTLARMLKSEPLPNVTAAILAGGRGTRLRSVVGDCPKSLVCVCNRPYLTYLLDQLTAASVRNVVLLTGYKADHVYRTLGEEYRGLRLVHSPEPTPLGTGGAVRWSLPNISSSLVLLMNGDSWCDVDLNLMLNFHYYHQADLSIVLTKKRDTGRYGKLKLDPDGRVLRFKEKAQATGAGWVNAGIYIVNRALIADMPTARPVSLEEELIPQWIGAGKRVFGFCFFGDFIDIGIPESLRNAQRFFSDHDAMPASLEADITGKGWN